LQSSHAFTAENAEAAEKKVKGDLLQFFLCALCVLCGEVVIREAFQE
jgi:hypothetical protein